MVEDCKSASSPYLSPLPSSATLRLRRCLTAVMYKSDPTSQSTFPSTRTLKVRAFRALRAAAGRVGLQVVPKTYYSPIPDLEALPPGVFDRRSALRGIHFDLDEQMAWIDQNLAEGMREFAPPASLIDNASYGRVGADLLHGVVRGLKPRRIVELGSGHSTLFMAAAAESNRAEGVETELRTFDPYPSIARAGLPGVASLEPVRAQDVPLEVFTALADGDVLFVDTTHTVKVDSDVNRIVLDVLPALAPACSCTSTTSSCRTSTRGAGTRSPDSTGPSSTSCRRSWPATRASRSARRRSRCAGTARTRWRGWRRHGEPGAEASAFWLARQAFQQRRHPLGNRRTAKRSQCRGWTTREAPRSAARLPA